MLTVVHFAVGDADERGDIAVQVQQRMHLHRGLVLTKPGPGKQSQAEIDGGRVQRVQTLLQIHPRWDRGHTAVAQRRSTPGQGRHRFASLATRWRRPG